MGKTVGYTEALDRAKGLKSEDGENPEYDRALVELLWVVFGIEREQVCADMGLGIAYLYPSETNE